MTDSDIIMYCEQNTCLEIQDIFKYLYQMCFGCEHLAADYSYALERIRSEMRYAQEDDLPMVELLGDRFCRVHLKALCDDSEVCFLTELFIRSAVKQADGAERLESELDRLVRLADCGMLPFSYGEVTDKIDEWRKKGFPAVHHSDGFRKAHHPAYRVINQEYLHELGKIEQGD